MPVKKPVAKPRSTKKETSDDLISSTINTPGLPKRKSKVTSKKTNPKPEPKQNTNQFEVKIDYSAIANQYCHDVLDNKILACEYVKLACKRHLDDIERSETSDFPYYFNKDLANKRCAFSEKLTHVKGKWRGTKIKLEPFQIFIQSCIWGWVKKKNGKRRFSFAYIEEPRKNAKSTDAATAGLYMLVADGEKGAEIYSGATTEKQALEVFRPSWQMVHDSESFKEHFEVSLSGTLKNPTSIYRLEDMSRFELIVGNPGDGASPHCAIIDEYHEHRTSDQLDTMETGMGAREQPLVLVITTAGTDTSAPCYDLHLKAIKILNKTIIDESFFAIIFTIDLQSQLNIFKSPLEVIKRLQGVCSCGHAQTIQNEKRSQEDCVHNAIEKNIKNIVVNGVEKTLNVKTIQTEMLAQEDYAQAVTKRGRCKQIRNEEKKQIEMQKNGQMQILKNENWQICDGGKTEEGKNFTNLDCEQNTELQKKNTTGYQQNKVDCVLFADQKIEDYVLTIVTQLGISEDCYVKNVIPPSDSLRIVQEYYSKHSPICAIHKVEAKPVDNFIGLIFPPDDYRNFNVWKKANPNYLVSIEEDYLIRKYNETLTDASKQNINLCKHLNLWVNAGTAWMNMTKWAACADPTLSLSQFSGQPCYAALDLASKIDICSLLFLFDSPKGYIVFCRHYLPEETVNLPGNDHYVKWSKEGHIIVTPGARTDFKYIEDDLKEIHQGYRDPDSTRDPEMPLLSHHPISELAFDPKEATYLINNIMEWMGEDRCIEMNQSPTLMSEPMKEVEARVYSQTLWFNGDPVLNWMMGNVVKKQGRNSGPVKYYYPTKEKNEHKIDGAVCMIMAVGRAMLHGGGGGSPYDGLSQEEIMKLL